MEATIPNPIRNPHVEFAKALVKLAEEHGADDLSVEFNLSSSRRFFEKTSDYQKVKFNYQEGRHGSKASFSLTATATTHIKREDLENG